MDEREKLARIRLIQTRHIGPMTFSLLTQRYESALAVLAAIPDLAARGGRELSMASLANAKAELAANDDTEAKLIWWDSDPYPLRLAQFNDAPVPLSTQGNLHLLQKPVIALFGARNATINAIRHAETLTRELGEADYVIVSDMARGINAAANRVAVATGTVGVIEAAAKSGSMITAREAGERGSEVITIPRSPLDPRSNGCNQLIRDGATLVQNVTDIIEAVGQHRSDEFPLKKNNTD